MREPRGDGNLSASHYMKSRNLITARELKKILKRQTRCSTRHMIILDKEYSPISSSEVRALAKDYKKGAYIPEIWDCDDIARDFVNYVKKTVKNTKNQNVAFGMVVLRDHAQEVFIDETDKLSKRNRYIARYMDHRDWSIYIPNERPKWIII
jgi:hypothetical protein